MTPAGHCSGVGHSGHFGECSTTPSPTTTAEDALVDAVASQLAPALAAGDIVVVVATPEHRAAFEAALGPVGAESLVAHDAADLLATFMVDGSPDPVGIAPDDMGAVFEPFSRLRQPRNRQVKGTGLGLYIAKALIEGQGGTISLQSKVGVGSTFSYTVPVSPR